MSTAAQLNPGALSTSKFDWLLVQCCCSYWMMHGVLWRDISLCTDTHNNESAKLGHHNSSNSFPRESTTIAWQSGIFLKHCISCLAHYSFVMAALHCTVSVPLHYVFALKSAVLCVKCMSLHVLMSLFVHLCHVYELIISLPYCVFTIQYILEILIEYIDFSQFVYWYIKPHTDSQ